MTASSSEEKVASVLKTGTWHDWMPKFPRPILAIGPRDLYWLLFQGSGFTLAANNPEPVTGFFANVVVAASNVREAESRGRQVIVKQWRRRGFARLTGAEPVLAVDDVSRLVDHFRLRSRFGFAFF